MLDMTTGKPLKLIVKFSVPLLIGNFLQLTYNIVDSIVVGNLVGKDALAAVGNSFVINFLLISLFAGIGMGAAILVAQFFGAKDDKNIKATVSTLYIAMTIASIFITVVGYFTAEPLLAFMKTPQGDIMEMSKIYLRTLFLGTFATFGYNINNSYFQGMGDSKTPLLFLAITSIVNIVLDFVFVAVFNMDVFGVALATIISQALSFILGILYIYKKIPLLQFSFKNIIFSIQILKKSIQIGLPAGIQNILFSVGTMVLHRLINSYGSSFMAGYIVVNRIDMVVFLPITSFASAMTTYVGQNIGAKRLDRVKLGVKSTMVLALAVTITMSIFSLIFGRYLLLVFTQNEEVIVTGIEFINRLMPFYFFLTLIFLFNAIFRGAGKAMFPLITSFVGLLIIRIPTAYIYDYFWGKYALFWCFATGWGVGAIMSIVYYFSKHWEKNVFAIIEESK